MLRAKQIMSRRIISRSTCNRWRINPVIISNNQTRGNVNPSLADCKYVTVCGRKLNIPSSCALIAWRYASDCLARLPPPAILFNLDVNAGYLSCNMAPRGWMHVCTLRRVLRFESTLRPRFLLDRKIITPAVFWRYCIFKHLGFKIPFISFRVHFILHFFFIKVI